MKEIVTGLGHFAFLRSSDVSNLYTILARGQHLLALHFCLPYNKSTMKNQNWMKREPSYTWNCGNSIFFRQFVTIPLLIQQKKAGYYR